MWRLLCDTERFLLFFFFFSLPPSSLAYRKTSAQVSRKWRVLANDPALWRLMSERWKLLTPEDLTPNSVAPTRSFYVSKYAQFQLRQAEAEEMEVCSFVTAQGRRLNLGCFLRHINCNIVYFGFPAAARGATSTASRAASAADSSCAMRRECAASHPI